jgi:hypothetical protein
VQVAAEKAKWRIGEPYTSMSSRKDGGGARADIPPTPRDASAPRLAPIPQRTSYDRPVAPPPPEPLRPPPPAAHPAAAALTHGATRFSSFFGRRR